MNDNTKYRYGHLFEKLDLNKDGKIDSEELAEGLYNLGYAHIRFVDDLIFWMT